MARAYIKEENRNRIAKLENLSSHGFLSWWRKQNLFIKIILVIIGIWLAGFIMSEFSTSL